MTGRKRIPICERRNHWRTENLRERCNLEDNDYHSLKDVTIGRNTTVTKIVKDAIIGGEITQNIQKIHDFFERDRTLEISIRKEFEKEDEF